MYTGVGQLSRLECLKWIPSDTLLAFDSLACLSFANRSKRFHVPSAEEGNAVHLSRALSMEGKITKYVLKQPKTRLPEQLSDCLICLLHKTISFLASFFAQQGDFERALQDQQVLQMVYRIEQHSSRIVEQYHRDYAAECFSQSIQWYYLIGQHEKASRQADVSNHARIRLVALEVCGRGTTTDN